MTNEGQLFPWKKPVKVAMKGQESGQRDWILKGITTISARKQFKGIID
jgi:hypothetical protein